MNAQIEYNINGVDLKDYVLKSSLTIQNNLTDKVDSCSLVLIEPPSKPQQGEVIIITYTQGSYSSILFGGIIDNIVCNRISPTQFRYDVSCVDYQRILEYRLVTESYDGQSCKDIIEDIISRYVNASWGFTTNNVQTGPTIDKITFNYLPVSECIRKLAKITNYEWYVDENKDIHFFQSETNPAPYEVDSDNSAIRNLNMNWDFSGVINRVNVHGGSYLSSPKTESFSGDDTTVEWNLEFGPHDLVLYLGATGGGISGATKYENIGAKNLNDGSPLYDFLVEFPTKKIYVNPGIGPTPATGETLWAVYLYDVKVIARINDEGAQAYAASLEGGDGIHETLIKDETITNQDEASDRAYAEIYEKAYPIVRGSFETYLIGFKAGQIIFVEPPNMGVSGDYYIINTVAMRSAGAGIILSTVQFSEKPKWASDIIADLVRFIKQTDKSGEDVIDRYAFHIEDIELDDSSHTFTLTPVGSATWGPDGNQGEWNFSEWG